MSDRPADRLANDIIARIQQAYREHPDYTEDEGDGFAGGMIMHAVILTTWIGGDGDRWFDQLYAPDSRSWDIRGMLAESQFEVDEWARDRRAEGE